MFSVYSDYLDAGFSATQMTSPANRRVAIACPRQRPRLWFGKSGLQFAFQLTAWRRSDPSNQAGDDPEPRLAPGRSVWRGALNGIRRAIAVVCNRPRV